MNLQNLFFALFSWWFVIVPCFNWHGLIALIGVIVLLVLWVFGRLGWVKTGEPL